MSSVKFVWKVQNTTLIMLIRHITNIFDIFFSVLYHSYMTHRPIGFNIGFNSIRHLIYIDPRWSYGLASRE